MPTCHGMAAQQTPNIPHFLGVKIVNGGYDPKITSVYVYDKPVVQNQMKVYGHHTGNGDQAGVQRWTGKTLWSSFPPGCAYTKQSLAALRTRSHVRREKSEIRAFQLNNHIASFNLAIV